MTSQKVFITGSTGFIGKAILDELVSRGHYLLSVLVRTGSASLTHPFSSVQCIQGDLQDIEAWSAHLEDVDVVIHAAAKTQVLGGKSSIKEMYRKSNVKATLDLATIAARSGVRRFIFLSSVKVNGEQTLYGKPFTIDDTPAPTDMYGITKLEAEQGLLNIAASSGMEMVILRPPLVYGPHVKGNFLKMLEWTEKGVPLPLGRIKNKRSLVGLHNLIDLICVCISHPGAANRIFMVSDDNDISTPDLLKKLADKFGNKVNLLPIPAKLILAAATVLGKKSSGERLVGSLCVDIAETKKVLTWHPPFSMDHELNETVNWYRNID